MTSPLAIGRVGRYDEALTLWEQTLIDMTRVLGPYHPDTLNTLDQVDHLPSANAAGGTRRAPNIRAYRRENLKVG